MRELNSTEVQKVSGGESDSAELVMDTVVVTGTRGGGGGYWGSWNDPLGSSVTPYSGFSAGEGLIGGYVNCGGDHYLYLGAGINALPVDASAGFVTDCDGVFAGPGFQTGAGAQALVGADGAGVGINTNAGAEVTYGVNVSDATDLSDAGFYMDTMTAPDGDGFAINFPGAAGYDDRSW
ncbi:MAG: hypothetical protein AAGB04_08630 [Pseudomonadota bacterium]